MTALSIRDDHSSTSGRYTLTDEEDDRVDLKLNPVAGRRWVDPRARWRRSLAPHLHADSPEHARDILTATVLCECSYKSPEAHVRERVAELSREDSLRSRCACRASAPASRDLHEAEVSGRTRARGDVSAFTGTREAMDFLADASFLQTPLAEGLGLGSDVGAPAGGGRWCTVVLPRAPRRCGRTYARRGVAPGKGAIGSCCADTAWAGRSRRWPPSRSSPSPDESQSAAELRCVAFASPPVGNSALRRAVWERGWGPRSPTCASRKIPSRGCCSRRSGEPRQAKVDGPRQPPTRDNSREANAARRLPRLVPMVRRSDETQGDGKGSAGKSSYLRAAGRAIRPEYVHLGPVHHLLRGGGIVSSDGHATFDDEGGAAGAAGGDVAATDETREGGPGAIAAVRHAVLRHTMRDVPGQDGGAVRRSRAHRARG